MLLWQVAERSAHQEGQPPMARGDLVLWTLWEENETVSRSDQGNIAFMGVFEGRHPFLRPVVLDGIVYSRACCAVPFPAKDIVKTH